MLTRIKLPCEQRFLYDTAFSVYEVVRVACLSRSWFVYSPGSYNTNQLRDWQATWTTLLTLKAMQERNHCSQVGSNGQISRNLAASSEKNLQRDQLITDLKNQWNYKNKQPGPTRKSFLVITLGAHLKKSPWIKWMKNWRNGRYTVQRSWKVLTGEKEPTRRHRCKNGTEKPDLWDVERPSKT